MQGTPLGLAHRCRAQTVPAEPAAPNWALNAICAVLLGAMAASSGKLQAADNLSYTLSWLGIPVVEITVAQVESTAGVQHEYHARTRRWFKPIYAVDNHYRIWLDAVSGYPLRYEKEIHERRHSNHLWAQYDLDSRQIIYGNGEQRPWPEPTHTFFSALVWVQRHPWRIAELQPLVVEVEGVVWQVAARCTGQLSADRKDGPLSVVEVRFERQVAGRPVLADTDIVTRMLPGEGHAIRLGIDPLKLRYNWIEFGSQPFLVRAKLNLAPRQP